MKRQPLRVFWKGKDIYLPPTTIKLRINRLDGSTYDYDEHGRFLLARGYIKTELLTVPAYGPVEVCGIPFMLTKRNELPESQRGLPARGFRLNEPITGRRVGADTVTAEEALDNAECAITETGVGYVREVIRVVYEGNCLGVQIQPIELYTLGIL
jgi:hypothetical protein